MTEKAAYALVGARLLFDQCAAKISFVFTNYFGGCKTFQVRSRLLREAFEGGADIFGGSGVEAALPDVFCQAL